MHLNGHRRACLHGALPGHTSGAGIASNIRAPDVGYGVVARGHANALGAELPTKLAHRRVELLSKGERGGRGLTSTPSTHNC